MGAVDSLYAFPGKGEGISWIVLLSPRGSAANLQNKTHNFNNDILSSTKGLPLILFINGSPPSLFGRYGTNLSINKFIEVQSSPRVLDYEIPTCNRPVPVPLSNGRNTDILTRLFHRGIGYSIAYQSNFEFSL